MTIVNSRDAARISGTADPGRRFQRIRTVWRSVMTRTLTIAAAAMISITTMASSPANAQWRHHHHYRHFPVGPVIGGLAAGALIGAAVAGAPRVYYEPVYVAPACYVRRERFWDGWAWRYRKVEVC
jgi:hypothetical protein